MVMAVVLGVGDCDSVRKGDEEALASRRASCHGTETATGQRAGHAPQAGLGKVCHLHYLLCNKTRSAVCLRFRLEPWIELSGHLDRLVRKGFVVLRRAGQQKRIGLARS